MLSFLGKLISKYLYCFILYIKQRHFQNALLPIIFFPATPEEAELQARSPGEPPPPPARGHDNPRTGKRREDPRRADASRAARARPGRTAAAGPGPRDSDHRPFRRERRLLRQR